LSLRTRKLPPNANFCKSTGVGGIIKVALRRRRGTVSNTVVRDKQSALMSLVQAFLQPGRSALLPASDSINSSMSRRAMREEAFGGGTSGQNKSANQSSIEASDHYPL